MNSPTIKFENHFKLNIPFRDKILFESELIKNNINFYYEENQPNINISVRYFLKDSDSNEINKIIHRNQIIASTDNLIVDYKQGQQIQMLYLKVMAVVVLITLIATFLINLFK